MDEQSASLGGPLPQGFSCPGLFWLPGVLVIPVIHFGVLALLFRGTAEVGAAVAALAGFWVAFLAAARWLGANLALNLLGLVWSVLLCSGLAALVVWWLVGVARA